MSTTDILVAMSTEAMQSCKATEQHCWCLVPRLLICCAAAVGTAPLVPGMQDNCSMYAKLALFIFAAWAGKEGNGIIVGCAIAGVAHGVNHQRRSADAGLQVPHLA